MITPWSYPASCPALLTSDSWSWSMSNKFSNSCFWMIPDSMVPHLSWWRYMTYDTQVQTLHDLYWPSRWSQFQWSLTSHDGGIWLKIPKSKPHMTCIDPPDDHSFNGPSPLMMEVYDLWYPSPNLTWIVLTIQIITVSMVPHLAWWRYRSPNLMWRHRSPPHDPRFNGPSSLTMKGIWFIIPQSKPHGTYTGPMWLFIFEMNWPIFRVCFSQLLRLKLILGCALLEFNSLCVSVHCML